MSTVMERQSRYRQMMDPGSYDGQSAGLHLSSMSQPDPSVNFGATPYQSCTLPRPSRPRGGVPATAASGSRRQILSNRVSDYLKSLNSMTRSIVLEKEYVEERHAGEWQCMDETLQEDVVDDYFMPLDVHAHYGTLPRSRCSYREPRSPSAASTSSHDQRFSFRNAWVPSALSQPPDTTAYPTPSSPTQTYFIPPTHNRLHKNQLSYRSKALRKVMNLPLPTGPEDSAHHQHRQQQQPEPHHQKRDSGLGSDGESPRTSDEDQNPLAFQRNHLRSFSLRQKKGGARNHGSLSRSSTRRAPQRITAGSENTRGANGTNSPGNSRQGGPGYDAEVDLPDDSLLHDLMGLPPHTTKRDLARLPNRPVPMYHNRPAVVLTNLRRVHSEDSIDTDTESIAQSNVSNLSKSTGILTEDELLSDATIPTCLTPESLLSVPSTSGGKRGLVRSRPQSRRGGSFLQTSTSEFANRRAQFKPNMLRNHISAQSSPTHTRQSTPSFSRQNTPGVSSPTPHPEVSSPTPAHPDTSSTPHHHKAPTPPSLPLKHRRSSVSGSIDLPISPEQILISPHTPLVKSISTSGGSVSHHLHIRKNSTSEQQKRESGYISSSSESFPFPARK
ncbi:hypothetical protein GBAR_LOCUS30307 [Geodia barretti]|uniref:DUF4706 domain-containing protein n=1 Tax=Geodia barretti TaxID=519541 RepID=A0AA35TXJ0_GEOBA|nr:hypothetical protein GBAR_LOCUS30307 [Geodia barretti]